MGQYSAWTVDYCDLVYRNNWEHAYLDARRYRHRDSGDFSLGHPGDIFGKRENDAPYLSNKQQSKKIVQRARYRRARCTVSEI